jgi:hypothetical protein
MTSTIANVAFNLVIAVGSALLGSVAFDRVRKRELWAKVAIFVFGIIGVARGSIDAVWHLDWLGLTSDVGARLENSLSLMSGVALGILFSLVISGQLFGSKRKTLAVLNEIVPNEQSTDPALSSGTPAAEQPARYP